jgi:hypothetical protein
VRPFSARFYSDTVIIDPLGAARRMACAVQPASDSYGTSRQENNEWVQSKTTYTVLFADDPGVALADVRLHWTANAFETFAAPVVLTAKGPARPPSGLKSRWTLDVENLV